MDGNEREGVSKEDLSYMLLVIRGVRDVSREVDCEQPNENAQGIARFIIYDDDGVIQFRKGGQAKFAAKFRSFYINKLQAEASSNYPRIGKPAEVASEKHIQKKP